MPYFLGLIKTGPKSLRRSTANHHSGIAVISPLSKARLLLTLSPRSAQLARVLSWHPVVLVGAALVAVDFPAAAEAEAVAVAGRLPSGLFLFYATARSSSLVTVTPRINGRKTPLAWLFSTSFCLTLFKMEIFRSSLGSPSSSSCWARLASLLSN